MWNSNDVYAVNAASAQNMPNDSHHSSPGPSIPGTENPNNDTFMEHHVRKESVGSRPYASLWRKAGEAHGVQPVNVMVFHTLPSK